MIEQVGQEFTGKTALVTGGSSGIGQATAQLLARRGAQVVFCSNDPSSVTHAEAAGQAQGVAMTGVVADVAVAADMQRFVAVAATLGGVDLLANCAGIRWNGTVVDTAEADWDRIMAVNLKGIFLAAKHAIPEMRRRSGGAIVNVSSVQAYVVRPKVAAYAATKGAINALTRSMALDHAADSIRVNAVCPGLVDTPLVRSGIAESAGTRSREEILAERVAAHPLGNGLGRACTAKEVAEVIAFLLSDRSSYVSGAAYTIDGALSVQALG